MLPVPLAFNKSLSPEVFSIVKTKTKVKLETAGTILTQSLALIVKVPFKLAPSTRLSLPFGTKVKTLES